MNCGYARAWRLILAASVIVATTLVAAETVSELAHAPRYKSPFPNAPKVRVDGRTRGADDALLTLTVLAPEHLGLTTKAQPCLYWYQSKSTKVRFELTISERTRINPLLEIGLEGTPNDSIQCVCLAKHNVQLETGVEYRWTVAMVIDPANRSKDVIASGMIKRIEPPATLAQRLAQATPPDHPYIFADEGVWYDSLEALSKLIDDQPQDRKLHEIRAVYFMQVGLPEAARHEMTQASVTTSSPTVK